MASVESIEILSPGLQTTVQDLGRFGFGRYGVAPSGALDSFAHRIANLLVDNPENQGLKDLNLREAMTLVPLVVLMIWIGIYPKPVFRFMEKPVDYIVHKVQPDYFERAGVIYPEPKLYEADDEHGHARLDVTENAQ